MKRLELVRGVGAEQPVDVCGRIRCAGRLERYRGPREMRIKVEQVVALRSDKVVR